MSNKENKDQREITGSMRDEDLLRGLFRFFGLIMVVFLVAFIALSMISRNYHPVPDLSDNVVNAAHINPVEWEEYVDNKMAETSSNQQTLNQRVSDLQFQIDQNATTLAMIATFFGALITVVVIFFSFKQTESTKSFLDAEKAKVDFKKGKSRF